MTRDLKIDDLMRGLVSQNPEEQIASLDKALEVINDIARTAVQGLHGSSMPLFVAERLLNLGSPVVEPLEDLLPQVQTPEERIIVSLLLLQLGSTSGVDCLLDAIEDNDEYAPLVSNKLAAAHVSQAAERIISRLSRDDLDICRLSDAGKTDFVVSLLSALKTIGVELPAHLRRRFSSVDAPWQVRTIIQ
ncbi:MAG TPA: hypothetical protein VLM38_13605 [Blastocatellia bacterium]|nr:hypothetical protein [Blastocatellia bacterium]